MTDTVPQADVVRVETAGAIATVTLNEPKRLNAVDANLLTRLTDVITSLQERTEIRVIALTGAGRAFCAGATLVTPGDEDSGPPGGGIQEAAGRAIRALSRSHKPVVALVNGAAAGVGMSLALCCHYVLAAESAFFSVSFARLGLVPDGGATVLLAAHMGRARALRVTLRGEKVTAEQAAAWGLIAECCPDAEFAERSRTLLEGLATMAPLAVAEAVAAMDHGLGLEAALEREEQAQARLVASEDFMEGLAAFHERRPPVFNGR